MVGEHMSHSHTLVIEQTPVHLISGTKVLFLAIEGSPGEIQLDSSSPTADLDSSAAFCGNPRPASCRSARYRHPDRRKHELVYYSIGSWN